MTFPLHDIHATIEYSLDFQVLNAFTNRTFGGNPAAIVFLKEMLPDEVLEKIKDNFNQPIIVYISPPSSLTPKRSGVANFGLRWWGPTCEMRICGHGTCMLDFLFSPEFSNEMTSGRSGSNFPQLEFS
jgi:PhzF family phenazine biosynthesis protein